MSASLTETYAGLWQRFFKFSGKFCFQLDCYLNKRRKYATLHFLVAYLRHAFFRVLYTFLPICRPYGSDIHLIIAI